MASAPVKKVSLEREYAESMNQCVAPMKFLGMYREYSAVAVFRTVLLKKNQQIVSVNEHVVNLTSLVILSNVNLVVTVS
jgi:hypothetical protein